MTVEVYSGPGTESYRSGRFTAVIAEQTAYVYGWERVTEFQADGLWSVGQSVEMSFVTFGMDGQSVTVEVGLVGGAPVNSCTVYPKQRGITATISGGKAFVTFAATDVKKHVMLQVNGDTANVLWLHPHPLRSTAPGGAVVYNGTQVNVPNGTSLRFPAGVWTLPATPGQPSRFPVGSNTTVYLDPGAIVIGTFDVTNGGTAISTNVSFRGPGIISGEFILNEALSGNYSTDIVYALIYGFVGGQSGSGNSLREITLIQSPFHCMTGLWCNQLENVHYYGPWTNNSDGLRGLGDPSNNNQWSIKDCTVWSGDDSILIEDFTRHAIIERVFALSSYSAVIQLGYLSRYADYGWTTTITDFWTVGSTEYYYLPGPLGTPGVDEEGGAIIQCWTDNTLADGRNNHGRYHVTITNLYVEGPCICPLWNFKTVKDPWGPQLDGAGHIADIELNNVVVESEPSVRAIMGGLDWRNGIADFRVNNVTIDGKRLAAWNWTTYVDQRSFCYRIFCDGHPIS